MVVLGFGVGCWWSQFWYLVSVLVFCGDVGFWLLDVVVVGIGDGVGDRCWALVLVFFIGGAGVGCWKFGLVSRVGCNRPSYYVIQPGCTYVLGTWYTPCMHPLL